VGGIHFWAPKISWSREQVRDRDMHFLLTESSGLIEMKSQFLQVYKVEDWAFRISRLTQRWKHRLFLPY
jgi:hypothetical protein